MSVVTWRNLSSLAGDIASQRIGTMDDGHLAGIKNLTIVDGVSDMMRQLGLRMKPLRELGTLGPLNRDVGVIPKDANYGKTDRRYNRGPFTVHLGAPRQWRSSFASLWTTDGKTQRTLELDADSRLEPRDDLPYRSGLDRAWTAYNNAKSQLHVNLRPQLTSQALMAACTRWPIVSAAAWITFRPRRLSWRYPLIIWMNSTLGIIHRWIYANRTQTGRAASTKLSIGDMMCPDPAYIDPPTMRKFRLLYRTLRDRPLRPMMHAAVDTDRRVLDYDFLETTMGWPEKRLRRLIHIAEQWRQEPHIGRPQ